MDRKDILKISGLIVIPFMVMLIAAYFLYPYLNDEKYEEIVTTFDAEESSSRETFDEDPLPAELVSDSITSFISDSLAEVGSNILGEEIHLQTENEFRLSEIIDSLQIEMANLEQQLSSIKKNVEESEAEPALDPQEFSERVKSLLNLEEDDLAPILEKMTTKQLVSLYFGGGTIQREKILRSLNADKAAELITEIMS